jgi:hypothetical protein
MTSETLRRLVAELDHSDVIVYLHEGTCPNPATACVIVPAAAGPAGARVLTEMHAHKRSSRP